MKWFYFLFLCSIVFGCTKANRIINRLEGNWTFTERLNNDGTHDYFNDTYIFGGGNGDGETYLPLQVSGSENSIGDYLIDKKGVKMIFRKNINLPNQADTTTIEDWDKNSLIVRNVYGVLYFSKQ